MLMSWNLSNKSLVFYSFQSSGGNYTCSVTNQGGLKNNVSVHILVTSKSSFCRHFVDIFINILTTFCRHYVVFSSTLLSYFCRLFLSTFHELIIVRLRRKFKRVLWNDVWDNKLNQILTVFNVPRVFVSIY